MIGWATRSDPAPGWGAHHQRFEAAATPALADSQPNSNLEPNGYLEPARSSSRSEDTARGDGSKRPSAAWGQPPSSSRCLAICYPLGNHWPAKPRKQQVQRPAGVVGVRCGVGCCGGLARPLSSSKCLVIWYPLGDHWRAKPRKQQVQRPAGVVDVRCGAGCGRSAKKSRRAPRNYNESRSCRRAPRTRRAPKSRSTAAIAYAITNLPQKSKCLSQHRIYIFSRL